MISAAATPEAYIASLPDERNTFVNSLRTVILDHLPEGFEETMSYGMLSYAVPHSIFPAGYHCGPKQPLRFISLASQKNSVNVYHMGLYARPDLMTWFMKEWPLHNNNKKPDMGKSCLRFKKLEDVPLDLIGSLCERISVLQWIDLYTSILKK